MYKCLIRLHLSDQTYSENSKLQVSYYNLKQMLSILISNVTYLFEGKAEFSAAITLVISVTWSLILSSIQKTILLLNIFTKM